jgi:hypothetical protein
MCYGTPSSTQGPVVAPAERLADLVAYYYLSSVLGASAGRQGLESSHYRIWTQRPAIIREGALGCHGWPACRCWSLFAPPIALILSLAKPSNTRRTHESAYRLEAMQQPPELGKSIDLATSPPFIAFISSRCMSRTRACKHPELAALCIFVTYTILCYVMGSEKGKESSASRIRDGRRHEKAAAAQITFV